MKKQFYLPALCFVLLLTGLLVSGNAQAQAADINLNPDEYVVLQCFADQMVVRPFGDTQVKVTCNKRGAEESAQAVEPNDVIMRGDQSLVVRCNGDQIVLRLLSRRGLRVACTGAAIPPTDVPVPTETPVPPTDVPVPTDTVEPTPEPSFTSEPTATEEPTWTPVPPTSTEQPTNTALPPTETPTETLPATPTLTSTATPTFTTIPPTPTATSTPSVPTQPGTMPLCPSHDNYAWHALTDPARDCHYDHTHNDDPALGDAVFGPAAPWGTMLSYPWATSPMENTHKHAGYKYAVRLDMPCPNDYNGQPNNCIPAGRVQYHAVSSLMDHLARTHSFYLEYKICKKGTNQCGILKTGGWADFGILMAPYKQAQVNRPGGTVDVGGGMTMVFQPDAPELAGQSLNIEPYLAAEPLSKMNYYRSNPVAADQMEVWSMREGKAAYEKGQHPLARFTFRVWDSWTLVNPANPNELNFICADVPNHNQCGYNGSRHAMGEFSAFVPSSLDPDKDGFADYTGYTDRNGNIVQGCNAPGLDCVPLSLVHVPVGYADSRDPGNGSGAIREYDTSPHGEYWITFPN